MGILNFFSSPSQDYSYLKKQYIKNKKLETIPQNSFPVKCHNGTFVGKEKENIISYKGIPFAKPPIKNLRWKPPVECDNSNDVFEAYCIEKSPVQTICPGEIASNYETGEDCLYLNIWKNNDNEKDKPVMVFIHGGAFGWGGTSDFLYEGFNFVKNHKDIILVTIAYRVGMMGFIDLTQIKGGENYKASPNLGLLDQIQALKWINKNIENFGGDKNNVTIFGESAGASSVTILPLIKGSKGLFKRIISQSGSFAWAITRDEGKILIDEIKSEIKKERKEEIDMDYLLNLSEEEIINLNERVNHSIYAPMRDGYIIPEDCYGEVERGAYDGIDVMIGSNADEIGYFICEFGSYFLFSIGFRLFLENILYKRIKKNGYELFSEYEKCVKDAKSNFLNDLLFRSPALKIAQLHSKNNGNAYLYYWTYPSSIPYFGACHAVELAYIFNNLHVDIFIGDKNINYKLAEVSQNMWANFAKSGNPSTKDCKWEKYDEKNNYYMVLGKEVELKNNLFNKKRDELILPILDQYISYNYMDLSFNVPMVRKTIFIILAIFGVIISVLLNKYLTK